MGDFRVKLRCGLRVMAAAAVFVGAAVSGRSQSAAPAPSTKTMLVEPPAPLLPATLGKLTRSGDGDVGDGLGKLDAAGLSAQDKAAVTEDGLKRFAQSEYKCSAPSCDPLTVTVYQFGDVSGAIAAYDYLRMPGMRPVKLGDEAAATPDSWEDFVMRSGASVVRLGYPKVIDRGTRFSFEAMLPVTNELIEHLPKVGGTAAMAPLLPTLLPAKGFAAEAVRYALGPAGYAAMGGVLPGDVVGFDKSAEAVTAKAKSGGVLTLLLYPTPEIAGDHLRMIEQAMQQQGAAADTVVLRREGTLVAMTSGAWSPNAAQAMVDGIHLRSEVTFDKPMPVEFHAEVKKTYSLLMQVVIFSGIGFLAAVVLALFFGGGRALIRVMQGKPAATEPEFLRIDLREAGTTRLGGPKG